MSAVNDVQEFSAAFDASNRAPQDDFATPDLVRESQERIMPGVTFKRLSDNTSFNARLMGWEEKIKPTSFTVRLP